MYDSNTSRLAFLRYLQASGMYGIAIGSGLVGGCKQKEKLLHKIRIFGTGTLDIQEKCWKKAIADIGIDIRFTDNGNDTGPVIAQMISGSAKTDYHIGALQGGAESELSKAKAIIPWDTSKLKNWKTMWKRALDIPYTKNEKGEQIGIPVALNADSIIYLPDSIRNIPGYEEGIIDSYSAIFDPRLKGKVSMEDAWINSVIFAAIYLKENNKMAIGNPGNLTESELRDVMTFLIDKKKEGQFRKLWRGWEQGVDLLNSGEVVAMTGWEPIVYELQRRKINAAYAIPKEGYEGWSNDLLLHVGVIKNGSYDLAHEAADWLLNGYYGCKLADLRGYAVPNSSSITFAAHSEEFEEAEIKHLTDHVQSKFRKGNEKTYWQNVRPVNHRLYDEWWTRLRNA